MDYEVLDVWKRAFSLSVEVHRLTKAMPRDERFGLTAQMRRAATSIVSNIAEGEGRRSWPDRSHFYLQARGSLYELRTQILICEELRYLERVASVHESIVRVGQLINGTLRHWKTRIANRE